MSGTICGTLLLSAKELHYLNDAVNSYHSLVKSEINAAQDRGNWQYWYTLNGTIAYKASMTLEIGTAIADVEGR